MRVAVISAHKGSLSWTRMLNNIEMKETFEIKYFFSYSDEQYRNNRSFFSHIFLRIKTYILFPIYFILKSRFINNYFDKAVVITSPFFLPYLAAKLLKNVEVIILYNDIYPEALVDKKIISSNKFIYKMLCRLQLYTYKNTSFSIFIGKEHYDLAKNKYLLTDQFNFKIINVPSHLDTKLNNICTVNSNITCIYSGTIGLFHDFELFIYFLAFVNSGEKLNFIFNTNGAAKSKFEKQLNINFPLLLDSKIICLGNSVSSVEYEKLMNKSQIGIIFQDLNAGTVVFPSKFASMLVSGQAILAFMNRNCLMAKIILENDLGWVIDAANPLLVNEVLSDIFNEDILLRKRVKAQKYGIENYSISSVTLKWIDVLKCKNEK